MALEQVSGTAPRDVRFIALACFLVSGACGLAYEIVWVRQLTLLAGATTPAVSTVLAVFMGGLALGARWLGVRADHSRNPLRLYALLELGIGLYALVQPTLLEAVGAGYVALARHSAAGGLALMVARLGLAASVLLAPCVLMGGTLPVLVKLVGRTQRRLGPELGTLYGINLIGAVFGSLLTGFVLVREVGVHGTIVAAATGNLLVSLVAFLASRGESAPDSNAPVGEEHPPHELPAPSLRVVLWVLAGLSGFATMAYQVVWTRILSFGFDSTVYAFTVILVTFLLGLSLGSLVFARLDARVHPVRLLLAGTVFGGLTALLLTPLAAWQPAVLALLTSSFGFTGGVQLASMAGGAVAVILLPTILMGIVFPLVSRMLVVDIGHVGQQLGGVYWINTLGSIFGSLLTGFVLIPVLSLKGCVLALATAQVAAGLLLLPWTALRTSSRVAVALGLLSMLIVASGAYEYLLPGESPFDQIVVGRRLPAKLLAHRDDVAASVSVVEGNDGTRALRINGFETAVDNSDGAYMPMMSHLPLILHPHPKRVLVICFGTGSTAGAALYHPGVRVDAVDISRAVLEFAPFFQRTNNRVFEGPRARLIVDDGRNYLMKTGETYDVITSEPMPPTHAGVVNLYSREYYELARRHLAPNGLLVQWLPFHLVKEQEALDILQTVRSVFPETTLWMHAFTGLIVASADRPVRLDAARLREIWGNPVLAGELARLGLPSVDGLAHSYMLSRTGVAELTRDGRVVSDDRPTLEFHPPRHAMLERMGPYTRDSARVMDEIYRLRAGEHLPLDGVAPEVARTAQAMFDMDSVILRGDVWMELDQPGRARETYESGLDGAPEARPILLHAMAWAERAAGNTEEARRLLHASLELQPENDSARAMLRELERGESG